MSESKNGLRIGYSRRRHQLRRLRLQILHPIRFRRLQRQRVEETSERFSLRGFDELQCIFVHIPKCAGLALCNTLFRNNGAGHRDLKAYQLAFSPDEYARYFKFTFVRNPWDRLVSAYFYLKKGGRTAGDKAWADENLSPYKDFDHFVRSGLRRPEIISYKHFRPQHDFVSLDGQNPAVDFVGRFETLEADFAFICRRLNVELKLRKENQNASRQRDFRGYYTEETRQIVSDVYAGDIRMFDYVFEAPASGLQHNPAADECLQADSAP